MMSVYFSSTLPEGLITLYPPNQPNQSLSSSPLLEIFPDKKINKSRYSKNSDIYKVPSIKKNNQNRNIKYLLKIKCSMVRIISTRTTSLTLQIIKITVLIEILFILIDLAKVIIKNHLIMEQRGISKNKGED